NYVPFEGIALADTFQASEDGDPLDFEVFRDSNDRIRKQKQAPIHVIVGKRWLGLLIRDNDVCEYALAA
ncbi:hypothetical protein, partial [Corynebacterium glucuronolyticum]|uniref:hypothetical protein n=1 Tax=Corynebacterium glucuronolyticum TaxID=39791 RepID=UPI00223B3FBD